MIINSRNSICKGWPANEPEAKRKNPGPLMGKWGKALLVVKTLELQSWLCHQLSVLSVLRPLCFSFPFRGTERKAGFEVR